MDAVAMCDKSCFNDLSTELILCIFDYLSVRDRYYSFYDYDTRLRVLVKERTEFSRRVLNDDIQRYSTLHSWYKHLTFEDNGDLCFIWPMRGQQLRYTFDPCVTDSEDLHWWFTFDVEIKSIPDTRIRSIISRYPIRLNPFFYHKCWQSSCDSTGSQIFYGGDIILFRAERNGFCEWLNQNYAEYFSGKLNSTDFKEKIRGHDLNRIFENEWLKATTAIHNAAAGIWQDLKALIDVNPFQIELST